MYLMPWQIFVFGCICGIVICVIVIATIILRIAFKGGVKVEHYKVDREEDKNE